MHTERYQSGRLSPGSLGLSLGIVGGLIAAGMLSSTVIEVIERERPPLVTYPVPPDTPPPPPEKPLPKVAVRTPPKPIAIDPIVETPAQPDQPAYRDPGPIPFIDAGAIEGTGTSTAVDPPKPPPVLVRADVDGRFRRDFQPIYPAAEQRAGNEGVVSLRVLIGVDGRVRQVERLASPSDAFWRATEQRALTKWRFTPATRDGVPYESWKTMTVRFRISEA